MSNELNQIFTKTLIGLDCVAGATSEPVEITTSFGIVIQQIDPAATGTVSIYCSADGETFTPWVQRFKNYDFTEEQPEIRASYFNWEFMQIVVDPGGTGSATFVIQQRRA
jgi:hypothetical protein